MARPATSSHPTRSETDSFGPIDVAADRYWAAQTERSRRNFRIGLDRMPMPVVHALAMDQLAAAETNRDDSFPTAMHIAAAMRILADLVPALSSRSDEPTPRTQRR